MGAIKKPLELRPSSASRWLYCAAFPILDQDNPVERTDEIKAPWLVEGTAAHYVAEKCLKEDLDPRDLYKETLTCTIDEGTSFERPFEFEVDGEMVVAVEMYIGEVDRVRNPGVNYTFPIKVEKTVGINFSNIRVEGTADTICLKTGDVLSVIDFKYGANVEVVAERNKQLAFYLLAAKDNFDKADVRRLEGIIVQPRLRFGDPIKRWVVDGRREVQEFVRIWERAFSEAVRRVVEARKDDLLYFVRDDICHWCPCLSRCHAVASEVEMLANRNEEDIPKLPSGVVSDILRKQQTIKNFLKELSNVATTRAMNGEKFPGLKLVTGGRLPNREWKDPEKVAEELEVLGVDDGFESPKIKSPARMEVVTGKEFVDKRIKPRQLSGPPLLVDESDTRPEYVKAAEEFEEFILSLPETEVEVDLEQPLDISDELTVDEDEDLDDIDI